MSIGMTDNMIDWFRWRSNFCLKSEGCGVIKPGDQGNKKGTKELNTIEYPLILNNDGKDRPRPIFVESLFLKPLYED